jgi:aryl-alcohol dehydrogenase-like predicted oxidoreductase
MRARGQFGLANNYGPPYGSAETNFGEHLRRDFKPYRDELIISSKAGWDMWPGPCGQGGGSRKYVLASLDQSPRRARHRCAPRQGAVRGHQQLFGSQDA